MCGILGYLSRSPLDLARLRSSSRLMMHRGMGAQNCIQNGMAGLAFQRLAIIDLTAEGGQPMTNETGDVWVVFNGEIYNFEELRGELESRHQFRSRTDTEVLIHGYEEWGFESLLRRIDGMFAFAVWDSRREELWFARDRVGKKPLYFSHMPDAFAFASTLNALVNLLPTRPSLDYEALDQYLVYQAVPAPRTLYNGVRMLPPAHYGLWKEGTGLKIERYWRLSYAAKRRRTDADLLDELDLLVRQAIERRLAADVPVGAFLSGGVDSSLIVALMSRLREDTVEAVNVGFDEAEFDERPFARQVAAHTGARLHETVLTPNDLAHLPEIVWHYGQPLADVSIVPTFMVAREARQHMTVVLNGDGGDEVFAGYARPVVARLAQGLRAAVPVGMHGILRDLLGRGGRRGQMLAAALNGSPRSAFTYTRGLRSVRDTLYTAEFLRRLEGGSHPDSLYADAWDSADGPTDADHALYGDMVTYLPDQLLVKMDVCTMAHGVEARSPFLDTRLLEFAASVPVANLTRGYETKSLLKRLTERYVPRHLVYRRKRGFVMPAALWLRGPLVSTLRESLHSLTRNRGLFRAEAVDQILQEHLSGRIDWTDVLWTLLILEIWFQVCIDRTLSNTALLKIDS